MKAHHANSKESITSTPTARFTGFVLGLLLMAVCNDRVRGGDQILSVDFNAGTANEQAGWNQFGWPTGSTPGPASVSYSGLDPVWTSAGTPGQATLTLSAGDAITSTGGMLTRDRGAPMESTTGFPFSDVYRDFINAATSVSLWIKLSGLTPEQAYDLTLYVYDNDNSRKMAFVDYTGGSPGTSGHVSFIAGSTFDSTTPMDVFAATLAVASDASGAILVRVYPPASGVAGTIGGLVLKKGTRPSTFALTIDFGSDLRQVQSGFSPFNVPTADTVGPITNTYRCLSAKGSSGAVAVTLAAGTGLSDALMMLSRDRAAPASDVGAFTYSDVYRDLIIAKNANTPFWLGVSGLIPDGRYSLTFYVYDNNNSRTMTFTDYTQGTPGASAALSFSAGTTFDETTPNDILSVEVTVTADENGSLLIREMPSSGGSAVINGLGIVFVPNQATLVSIR